ncbi:MAG: VWA domain-containing protein [Clostridia bacterium]|nr:VWA domain-containing protein [Clostridia bacterium]
MKKLSKKFLSVFLTTLVLLSTISCCFTSSAEDITDETTKSNNAFVLGEKETLKTPDTINCSHLCHNNSGIVKFFYKFACFLWKLFNINQYCKCGMAHYGLDSIVLDSDEDGFPDCLTNNDYTTDTDGDGLSDYQELMYCGTDPLIIDTDGDGIDDLNSDTDGDTLSNKYELSIGTHPTYADTDNDELNDDKEIALGTNPLVADTDEDGAADGWEIENGFDPLTFNDTFSIKGELDKSTDTTVTASVYMDINGKQTDTLNVTTVDSSNNAFISENIPGYIGNGYDFSIDGTFNEATLEFTYDTTVGEIGDDFQPRIYYLNEETGTFEELPNQTVENGKVTAVTTHFSTYILLNKVEFDKVWSNEIKSPIVDSEGRQTGIDVVFAIDVSGSMSSYSRLSTAKTALTTFLNALEKNDRAALVKFSSYSTIVSSLTSDINSVKSRVSGLSASGQTSMYKGLNTAINLLTNSSETYGYKMIVILSDGKDEPSTSYNSYYKDLVDEAIANDITIYTVGAGTSVSTSILTQVAENTGGSYYAATATSGITDAFEYIQSNTVDVKTDSNNDGIPDYYAELIKKGEMLLGNGSADLKGIDLNESADIDGDGLKNGEEIVVVENNGKVYLKYQSSPIKKDTDADGIPDNTDTARLTRGLKDGIIGAIKILSYSSGPSSIGKALNGAGHAYISYTSFINDTVDFYGVNVTSAEKAIGTEKNNSWVSSSSFKTHSIEMMPGQAITLGTWAGWVDEAQRGTYINQEMYCFAPYSAVTGQYSLTQYITESQLGILEYCTKSESTWGIIKNCSWFACVAWDAVTDDRLTSVGLYPNPSTLSYNIKKYSNYEYEQSYVASMP